MKAILLKGFGGSENLYLSQAQKPLPGKEQVLIRVMATSVNRPDIIQRLGNYPPPKGESEILGLEVSGVIEEVGVNVTGWKAGDRVMALVAGGAYAEYAAAYAGHVMSIPQTMSFHEAACICETYITAHLNVFTLGGLIDTEVVLLHGGGGGVNTAAIQLCQSLTPNAKVIVTASTAKVDRVRDFGVDLVIDYKTKNFTDEVLHYTDKHGVDVILDHIGGAYLSANMKALGVGGRLVEIGVMGGPKAELNIASMMVKRQRIIGSVLRPRPVAEKGKIIQQFKKAVVPLLGARAIVPLIHEVYPLGDVKKAHDAMESGVHFGKIVLEVAQ